MADTTIHTADPCLAFVTAWKAGRDQSGVIGTDAFYNEHVKPLEDQAAFGTVPTATTMQGAVAALQMVFHIAADEGDMSSLEPQDANLIRAALDFLAPTLAAGSSVAAIIAAHRSALAACDEQPDLTGPAHEAERAAWKTFALAPCLTAGDVQAKVAYLTSSERLSDWIDGVVDHQLELVRSLCLPAPIGSGIAAALAAAIERHRAASAVVDAAAAAREPYAWAEGNPSKADAATAATFWALDAAFNAACGSQQEALEAVLTAPILSLADMHAKSVYLASVLPGTADHSGAMAELLESMGSGGDVPVSVVRGEPDPLLALIGAYRAGVELQNAIPDEEWDEKAGAVEAEHIKPHHARLETDPPAATSLAGVMAALQLVADENDIGDTPDLTAAVSRAALAFFGEAPAHAHAG